jgi:DNA-binding transcriptional ArsR family regulator
MVKSRRTPLDLKFRALADPRRRAIVARLASGDATITDLARPLRLSLPAMHKHLRVLQRARLAVVSKHGRVRRCSLDARGLEQPAAWIERHRAIWKRRLGALGLHLEGNP